MEGAARFLLSDIGTTGSRNNYHSRLWYAKHPPQKNHLGFRDRTFSARPELGVFRITIVGDSFTFGSGILESERISNLLEVALNKQGRGRFEVLNFGQPGANYEEHEQNLRLAIREANPHYILLQWYHNDLDDSDDRRPRPKHLSPIQHRRLIAYSALYFLANLAFVNAQIRFEYITVDKYYARFLDPEEPISNRANARLLRVLDVARDLGVPIALYIWPDLTRPLGTSPADRLIEQLLTTCRSESIECVDLRTVLSEESKHERLIVNRFDTHASALANRRAANFLLETFGPGWIDMAEKMPE